MAEKKSKATSKKSPTKAKTTKAKAKTTKAKAKTTKAKAKTTKSKSKKIKDNDVGDMGIVIVDDDLTIDQEKINEERRLYLEEARSQEAVD